MHQDATAQVALEGVLNETRQTTRRLGTLPEGRPPGQATVGLARLDIRLAQGREGGRRSLSYLHFCQRV